MRLFSALAAAAFVMTAAPAMAQTQAPAQTPAPAPAPAQAPMSVAQAEANLEAASQVIEPIFAELKAQGDAIRADASLAPDQKLIRIGEAIAARQPQIDEFITAVQALVYAQAAAAGATREQATAAAETYRGLINQTLLQSMATGQAPQ